MTELTRIWRKWGSNWTQSENDDQIEQTQREWEPNVYLSL